MSVAPGNELSLTQLHQLVADIAQGVMDGRICITEASRTLTRLAFRLGLEDEEIFIGFRGIDSETDTFPLGEVRALWNPLALLREDIERERYEAEVRESVVIDCAELVRKYGRSAT